MKSSELIDMLSDIEDHVYEELEEDRITQNKANIAYKNIDKLTIILTGFSLSQLRDG